jgi:hypothetical protein
MGQLREWGVRHTEHNFLLTEELLALLSELEANGIPAIAYKGPGLAAMLYGDLAMRQFNDLDIIVEEQLLDRAYAVLKSRGYQVWQNLACAAPQPDSLSNWQTSLVSDDERVVVELHWSVSPDHFFPIAPELLWTGLQRMRLGDVSVRSFTPETLLLILCLHGSIHLWERLGWVCDLAQLIRLIPDPGWANVVKGARRLRLTRPLLVGLLVAQKMLDIKLPEMICQAVTAEPSLKRVAGRLVQETLAEHIQPAPPLRLKRLRFHLDMLDHPGDKARYLCHAMGRTASLSPRDRELTSIPPHLSFLHFLRRPVRLVSEYGPSSVRFLWRY